MAKELYPLEIGIQSVCRILDVDPAAMLREAGIVQENSLLRVTAETYFRCWEAAEALSPHNDVALLVGRAIALAPPMTPFLGMTCAPNYATGARRMAQYKSLVGPVMAETEETGEFFTVRYRSTEHDVLLPPNLGVAHLVYSAVIIRNLTAHPVQPAASELMTGSNLSGPLLEHIGPHTYEADRAFVSISFSRADADRSFTTENTRLWSRIEATLIADLAELEAAAPFSARVRRHIIEQLPTGTVSATELSTRLEVSQSTLQRRLRADGTSFQGLLDKTRLEMGQMYLAKTRLGLSEISMMLGFSDPNSFFRMFKDASGITPSEYRRSQEKL